MNVTITITDPVTGNYYGFDYTDNTVDIFEIAEQMKTDLGICNSDCTCIECKVVR